MIYIIRRILLIIFFFIKIKSQLFSISSNYNLTLDKNIISLLTHKNFFTYYGYSYDSQSYLIDKFYFKADREINIDFFNQNNEFAFADFTLNNIKINDKFVQNIKFNFSIDIYENYSNLATEINYKNNSNLTAFNINNKTNDENIKNKKNNKNFNFNCKMKIGKINYKIEKEIELKYKFIKIANIKNIIIGLNYENKMYIINNNYVNNTFKIFNNNYYCFNGETVNFFISKNFLILINKNNFICVFSYTINNNLKNNIINYNNIITNIKLIQNLTLNDTILHAIKIKNYLFLSIENSKSIFCYDSNNKLIKKFNYNNSKNDIISFVIINNNLIYAIEKNFGLIIFNIKNTRIIYTYYIPNAYYIDSYINPFNSYKFVSIFLNNNKKDEFLIEIIVNNEFLPIVNKILTYNVPYQKKPFFSNFLSIDNYFYYFLDINNSNIIIIRKGLLRNINFLSYFIPINNITNLNLLSTLIPFKINSTHLNLALLNKNLIFPITNLIYKNNVLNCFFTEEEILTLSISHNSDSCNLSINKKNTLCKLNNIYNFYIKKEVDHFKLYLIIMIIICFLIINFIGISIYIIYKKTKKEDLGFNIKTEFDLDNKNYVYLTQNTFDTQNNNMLFTKEFESNDNKNKIFYTYEGINKNNSFDESINNNNNNRNLTVNSERSNNQSKKYLKKFVDNIIINKNF